MFCLLKKSLSLPSQTLSVAFSSSLKILISNRSFFISFFVCVCSFFYPPLCVLLSVLISWWHFFFNLFENIKMSMAFEGPPPSSGFLWNFLLLIFLFQFLSFRFKAFLKCLVILSKWFIEECNTKTRLESQSAWRLCFPTWWSVWVVSWVSLRCWYLGGRHIQVWWIFQSSSWRGQAWLSNHMEKVSWHF